MSASHIKLVLEYDGTRYHGWQRQLNALSVQEVLEEAIAKLTGEQITVTAAGRTDAGVHARGQVVNFTVTKKLSLRSIRMGLNAHLPPDVVVKKAEQVPESFHARFDARQRIYQYFISTEQTAIFRHFCWPFYQRFDAGVLQPLADLVTGEHDFGAFSRLETQTNHKRCVVYESTWFIRNNFLIYRIVANRFLHGMVRTLVGTMMDVARGRFRPEQFGEIFRSRDRTSAGETAPARGLFLEKVLYPPDLTAADTSAATPPDNPLLPGI